MMARRRRDPWSSAHFEHDSDSLKRDNWFTRILPWIVFPVGGAVIGAVVGVAFVAESGHADKRKRRH